MDAKALWLFREQLGRHGLIDKLFQRFDEQLWASGLGRQAEHEAAEGRGARWTKKHGKSYYGYKNHINVDKEHKLIRRYAVTDASVHDSQVCDDVLDDENSGRAIWADSAYRSRAREEQLCERGYRSRIHCKGTSQRKLNRQEQAANHHGGSKIRARVEHVFGDQRTRQGGILVRTKGKVRAAVKIGLMNLTYNMRRLEFLLRPQSARCTG